MFLVNHHRNFKLIVFEKYNFLIQYEFKCLTNIFFIKFFFVLLMLFVTKSVFADKLEYQVKAAYLYQFTKFTVWPDNSLNDIREPLRICILGINPFGYLLDELERKTSKNRILEVKYLSSKENISGCHVVYICKSEKKILKKF